MPGTSIALTPPVYTTTQPGAASFVGTIETSGDLAGTMFVISGLMGVVEIGSTVSDPPGTDPEDAHVTTLILITGQSSGLPGGIGSYMVNIAGPNEGVFSQPLVATPPPVLSSGWDLYADTSGNIATVSGIAAQLQDVCCACRLFLGELWYDTTQGVPYIGRILGAPRVAVPPMSFVSAQLVQAGLTVPGVASIVPALTLTGRELTGTIGVVNQQGQSGTLLAGGGATTPWYVSAVSPDQPN